MNALKRSLGISPNSNNSNSNNSNNNSNNSNPNNLQDQSQVRSSVSLQSQLLLRQSSKPFHGQTQQQQPKALSNNPMAQGEVIPLDASEVRQKLMSVWHGFKYGKAIFSLDSKVQISANDPVWLLGEHYTRKRGQAGHYQEGEEDETISAFNRDFSTRLWFTYRKDFEEFRGTSLNTDCGWGCMIRSGQMMLANTLLLQMLGRKWRWKEDAVFLTKKELEEETKHKSIIRLFGDSNQVDVAPFSIHNLLSIAGVMFGRTPGNWFGPSSTAHLLKEALEKSNSEFLQSICVYISKDCTVHKGDVRNVCQTKAYARRKRFLRKKSEDQNNEEFSIVEYPSEYPPSLLLPTKKFVEKNNKGKLTSSVIDGVPLFEEAREMSEICPQTEEEQEDDGFHVLNDDTQNYSLNEHILVDGEKWITEGIADEKKANNNPTLSRKTKGSDSDDKKRWSVVSEGREATESDFLAQQTAEKIDKNKDDDWTPVLILVPLRLGTDKLNPVYVPCLKAMLATESCVGIIGGRPKHSLYFVGFQDNNLIHLDPHLAQNHVNTLKHSFNSDSYHCRTPRKMNISKMDPSCCIGFFCPTEQSFEGWCELTSALSIPPDQCTDYPMFGIVEGCSREDETSSSAADYTLGGDMLDSWKSDCDETLISEDFVFL